MEFTFQGHKVQVLRRAYQRTLNLRVKPSGLLRVTCCYSVRLDEIKLFILDNENFLRKSLASIAEVKAKYPRVEFVSGEKLMFKGRKIPLEVIWTWGKRMSVKISEDVIELKANINSNREERQSAIRKAYAKQARSLLAERTLHFGERMKTYPKDIGFRGQRTRWGSCSSSGKVNLNWKLIGAPPEVLDYVVIHEIAHLTEANHSSRFWALVERYCPDYRRLRHWLKANHYELEFLEPKSELHREV